MFLAVLQWVVGIIIVLVIGFFLFWKLYFLRDPAREIPKEGVVSPADGRVMAVFTLEKGKNVTENLKIPKGLLGKIYTSTKDVAESVHVICIFMSPLDVHVQRAPIEGKIKDVKYHKGTFMNAGNIESFVNEKNEILIEDINLRVKVIQIAGFLARRTECFVKEGEEMFKGTRIGRINLGSQCVLIMPSTFTVKVKKDDYVTAGETVMADIH